MLISDVIQQIKDNSTKQLFGEVIQEETTRDKILYKSIDINIECTGIVTCIYPSPSVIEKAIQLNANLIVCHEALFWNHGDRTDWLEESNNQAYLSKKKMLDDGKIIVWRNHDHIHSQIPYKGQLVDGIYYGFAKELGWENYIVGDAQFPFLFEIPQTDIESIINLLISRLDYNGLKVMGSLNNKKVRRVYIPFHILGQDDYDRELIKQLEKENIDVLIGQECIDFTVAEYIRDCGELGIDRTIIIPGHFNTEESGMKFFAEYYHEYINQDIPCTFVRAGDMYHYF